MNIPADFASTSSSGSLPPAMRMRLTKELDMMKNDLPVGISYCHPKESNLTEWKAIIEGPADSPYEEGSFELSISIPSRYPFEPPSCQFATPIYHCNVDHSGRICLDILKLPPSGSWKPSINLRTMLISLHVMMQDPNPDDPLLEDLAAELKSNYPLYIEKAKAHTKKYATKNGTTTNVILTNHTSVPLQLKNEAEWTTNQVNYKNPKRDSETELSTILSTKKVKKDVEENLNPHCKTTPNAGSAKNNHHDERRPISNEKDIITLLVKKKPSNKLTKLSKKKLN